MGSSDNYAIVCEDVKLSFDKLILKGINLCVPYGSIYGLIGESGGGKTSLIRCIWGYYKPNYGSISVLGVTPKVNDIKSQVPGPRLGLMPQDLSLDSALTGREVLTFFGRVHGIDDKIINAKCYQYQKMLNIPKLDCYIGSLSGGQARRLSFACAIIHDPQLLILDEPTVGSDPLSRNAMWQYLYRLKSEGCTTLITTHYVDELTNADLISVLREGKIWTTLDVPVLRVCYPNQSMGHAVNTICENKLRNNNDKRLNIICEYKSESSPTVNRPSKSYTIKSENSHWKANMFRSKYLIMRTVLPPNMLGIFISFIAVFMFSTIYGRFLKDTINVGVIRTPNNYFDLLDLPPLNSLRHINYTNEFDALHDTKTGKLNGYFIADQFGRERMKSWLNCLQNQKSTDLCEKADSVIKYRGDYANKVLADYIHQTTRETIYNYIRNMSIDEYGLTSFMDIIKVENFIDVRATIAEGARAFSKGTHWIIWRLLIHMNWAGPLFGLAPLLCADKSQGTCERLQSLGMTRKNHILSLFFFSLSTNLVLNFMSFAAVIYFCQPEHKGPSYFPYLIATLLSFCLNLFTFVAVEFKPDMTFMLMLQFGLMVGGISIGNILYPIQSMPYYAQIFTYVMPSIPAGQTMIDVMLKEMPILSSAVLTNIGVTFVHFIVLLILFIKYAL